MLQKFQEFIIDNNLCQKNDRILLGISGGIDSVCMFHLFNQLEFSIGIAHCNFQLRGDESDQDEQFVQELATMYDIPFFSTRFNTTEIAEKEGISIQMAARDLRYDWFEDIRSKYDYDYIAIAHNSDDVIETFFINLSRGSGIKGLSGIKSKTGKIIRPLLYASRLLISEYINNNNYNFREDSTNSSVKYSRNLIRHEVIPLFEKLNSGFRDTMLENINRLKNTETIYNDLIIYHKNRLIREPDSRIYISIDDLLKLNPVFTYLYEFLKPYGFSDTQIRNIIDSFNHISGKQFLSPTHRLIKDRKELIIEEISSKKESFYYIDINDHDIDHPIKLLFSKFALTEDFELTKSKHIGLFDIDKLEFPLILRKWQKGDYFMPLGMKNLKKLSDFFIDNKLSISEKENIWILESKNKIVWVIGQRIDERFKLTTQTNNIFKVEIDEK